MTKIYDLTERWINLKSPVFWLGLFIFYFCYCYFFYNDISPYYSILELSGDSQVYSVMGYSFSKGAILYKDVFDHKGPLLYLIYAFSFWLFSNPLAVFLLVVGCWYSNGIIAYKLTCLFGLGKIAQVFTLLTIPLLFIMPPTIIYPRSFIQIASPDGFILTLSLLSLYLYIKQVIKDNYFISAKIMFIQGLLAGLTLTLKPNMVLLWLPFGLYILGYLLYSKSYRLFVCNIIMGLTGVAITTLPWVFYALLTKSLNAMFFALFIYNFEYMNDNSISLFDFILNLFRIHTPLVLLFALSAWVLFLKLPIKNKLKVILFIYIIIIIYLFSLSKRDYPSRYLLFFNIILPSLFFTYQAVINKVTTLIHKNALITLFLILWSTAVINNIAMIDRTNFKQRFLSPYLTKNIEVKELLTFIQENNALLLTFRGVYFNTLVHQVPQHPYFFAPNSTLGHQLYIDDVIKTLQHLPQYPYIVIINPHFFKEIEETIKSYLSNYQLIKTTPFYTFDGGVFTIELYQLIDN